MPSYFQSLLLKTFILTTLFISSIAKSENKILYPPAPVDSLFYDLTFTKKKEVIDKFHLSLLKEKNAIERIYYSLVNSHYVGYYLQEKDKIKWMLYEFKQSGNLLSKIAEKESTKALIEWSSTAYIVPNDYKYIKKWIENSLKKNKKETLIALENKLYKEKIIFMDKKVEKYLRKLYRKSKNKDKSPHTIKLKEKAYIDWINKYKSLPIY